MHPVFMFPHHVGMYYLINWCVKRPMHIDRCMHIISTRSSYLIVIAELRYSCPSCLLFLLDKNYMFLPLIFTLTPQVLFLIGSSFPFFWGAWSSKLIWWEEIKSTKTSTNMFNMHFPRYMLKRKKIPSQYNVQNEVNFGVGIVESVYSRASLQACVKVHGHPIQNQLAMSGAVLSYYILF